MTEKVEPVSESKEEKKKKPRTERSGKRKANANSEQQNRVRQIISLHFGTLQY